MLSLAKNLETASAGVIWDGTPLKAPVIPAKAGTQSVDSGFPKVCGVGSRFRRSDCDSRLPVSQMAPVPRRLYPSTDEPLGPLGDG